MLLASLCIVDSVVLSEEGRSFFRNVMWRFEWTMEKAVKGVIEVRNKKPSNKEITL
jgi:hypothetical protein